MINLQYLDLPYRIVVYVMTGMFGAVLASFFTCMGSRIAEGKDWIKARSICDACKHELGVMDLVPVFSYLFHKGKCKYCGAKIPVSCILGEIAMAVYAILCVMKYGLSIEALRYILLSGLLLGLSVVDLATFEIPDGFIIAGIVIWLLSVPFMPWGWLEELKRGLIGGFGIGGGMLVASLIMDRILKKDSLGGGDIKLYFMTGLYMGILTGFFNLILSCLIGIVFVVVMKKDKIPFGPAISIATAFSVLYGSNIVNLYLSLFM